VRQLQRLCRATGFGNFQGIRLNVLIH
jgi:hypothetical protein